MYELVGSLASHVLARYPTPPIFRAAWFVDGDRFRRWFIMHGRGRPIRALPDLPLPLTRKMEHHFIASPPHLRINAALRRAEVLGLGGTPELATAILGTHLGQDLSHPAFWREAIGFLIRNADELGPGEIERIVAFLHAVGVRVADAANPFSLRGRTVVSLRRLIRDFRGALPIRRAPQWRASGIPALRHPATTGTKPEDAVVWHMVELRNARELTAEGRALRHCVGMYTRACKTGRAWIWSLRRQQGFDLPEPRYTVEVDPRTRTVVQIRGLWNCHASGEPRRLIHTWADAGGLQVDPAS